MDFPRETSALPEAARRRRRGQVRHNVSYLPGGPRPCPLPCASCAQLDKCTADKTHYVKAGWRKAVDVRFAACTDTAFCLGASVLAPEPELSDINYAKNSRASACCNFRGERLPTFQSQRLPRFQSQRLFGFQSQRLPGFQNQRLFCFIFQGFGLPAVIIIGHSKRLTTTTTPTDRPRRPPGPTPPQDQPNPPNPHPPPGPHRPPKPPGTRRQKLAPARANPIRTPANHVAPFHLF